jgi:hypothetical protein
MKSRNKSDDLQITGLCVRFFAKDYNNPGYFGGMKQLLFIGLITFMACNGKKTTIPQDRLALINYLKTEYNVDPQIKRFESIYIKELIAGGKSLHIDSLINWKIRVYSCKPLDLDFIEYSNRYYYLDRSGRDCYSIHLIRDNKTGKYYKDFIKEDACLIYEDYCSWSSMKNEISKTDWDRDISDEDIKAYNSIHSDRMYGKNETHFGNNKIGIQSYLNSVFKFSRPTKLQLDSLFYNYDKYTNDGTDTLLNSPSELYSFLRIQAAKIRSEPDNGDLNKQLEFLKGQINLLLLQIDQSLSGNSFFWIYKLGPHLRVRQLHITGNKKSSYSYYINEYQTCF